MKTPRKAHCAVCALGKEHTDLTAAPKLVERRLGKRHVKMMALVSPPRAEVTITIAKSFVRFFLCPRHTDGGSITVMLDNLTENGKLERF